MWSYLSFWQLLCYRNLFTEWIKLFLTCVYCSLAQKCYDRLIFCVNRNVRFNGLNSSWSQISIINSPGKEIDSLTSSDGYTTSIDKPTHTVPESFPSTDF